MYITILTERHGVYGFMGLWVYGFPVHTLELAAVLWTT
jgi:hypothetical protein